MQFSSGVQFSWDALTDCCGSEGEGAVVSGEFAGRVGPEEVGGGEGEREGAEVEERAEEEETEESERE